MKLDNSYKVYGKQNPIKNKKKISKNYKNQATLIKKKKMKKKKKMSNLQPNTFKNKNPNENRKIFKQNTILNKIA